jgi:copper oxidase (laccase) domain-containing protein
VRVALGPCIRACCYEVGSDVARRFPSIAIQRHDGRLHLDLPVVARLQLADAGLPEGAFEDTGVCTACHPGLCFSYRRDAAGTGRLWGLVALRDGGVTSGRDAGAAL